MSPFVTSRPLEDMINVQSATIALRSMTAKGGERLAEATRDRTPIDTSYSEDAPRQRPRGTARASVVHGAVRRHSSALGRGYEVAVSTEDPVFPYIEWDTRAHRIAPTAEHIARAAAEGRVAHLRFSQGGVLRYATSVWHPGTRGQHPFAKAAAYVQAEIGESFFREELDEFARNLTKGRVSAAVTLRAEEAEQIMSQAVASWIRANTVRFT